LKIAYILHWDLAREDGVTKKVRTQLKYWRRSACVKVFSYCSESAAPSNVEVECFMYRSPWQRIQATKRLVDSVRTWAPDVIYFRYDPPYPPLFPLFKNIPTVVELNTDDVQEYRLGPKLRACYNLFARRVVLKHAVGLIAVTHEIAQLPHITCYAKPTLVLGNALDLIEYPSLSTIPHEHPRLIFIGSEKVPWHGVDKLVWLAQQLPYCHIDLVGNYPQLQKTALPNLHIHGFLAQKDYESLMAYADLAIGTLALHHNNMNEASPLKVREYLAYGLPVIIGYQDTDFMNGARFILQLPNTENNVETHLEQIKDFIEDMRGYRVPRELVTTQIDAAVKEPQRLKFIRDVSS